MRNGFTCSGRAKNQPHPPGQQRHGKHQDKAGSQEAVACYDQGNNTHACQGHTATDHSYRHQAVTHWAQRPLEALLVPDVHTLQETLQHANASLGNQYKQDYHVDIEEQAGAQRIHQVVGR